MRRAVGILSHPITGAVCRLLLGGIFLYTAVPKLTHPAEFARLVYGYRILDPSLVNLAGITLPASPCPGSKESRARSWCSGCFPGAARR